MKRHAYIALGLVLAQLGCEPEVEDPKGPSGRLEYESMLTQIYRLERRVEVVSELGDDQSQGCGYLTERALRDLQGTIDALDPSVDYDFGLDGEDCTYAGSPAAQIHLEGFEHSPFSCDEFCCQAALRPVPRVYLHVLNNLAGAVLEVDGEPYVAIDPNEPCS